MSRRFHTFFVFFGTKIRTTDIKEKSCSYLSISIFNATSLSQGQTQNIVNTSEVLNYVYTLTQGGGLVGFS